MSDKRKPLILTLDPVDAPDDAALAPLADESLFSEAPVAPPSASFEPAGEAAPPEPLRAGAAAFRRRRLSAQSPSPEPAAVAQEPSPVEPAPALSSPAKLARAPKPRREPKPPRAPKPARAAKPPREPQAAEAGPALARWAYPCAIVAAVLWAGCLGTFVVGYERGAAGFSFAPLRWAVTALLALLPAALLLLFGYMVRQSARLADAARRAQAMADELAGPAALAGAQAHGVLGAVREEIARAQAAADEAARRMAALGDSLAEETRRVSDAALQAERAASRLGGRLQGERAELASLSGALDAQLAQASEGAARHARLAAEASDLAQANLQEAQAALAARTADLVQAAGEASRVSEAAGGELQRGGDRLERLAASLKREQAEWATLAQGLLSDQDDLAARLETERARFNDAAEDARSAAEALGGVVADGTRAAAALDSAAREHVEQSTDRFAAARADLEAEHVAALERIAQAARSARDEAARTAQEAAAAAESAAEAARRRVEGLAEAAFAAGQRADQALDTRLAAARRALDAQAGLVEEAGLRSAARIEAGLEAVQAALSRAAATGGPPSAARPTDVDTAAPPPVPVVTDAGTEVARPPWITASAAAASQAGAGGPAAPTPVIRPPGGTAWAGAAWSSPEPPISVEPHVAPAPAPTSDPPAPHPASPADEAIFQPRAQASDHSADEPRPGGPEPDAPALRPRLQLTAADAHAPPVQAAPPEPAAPAGDDWNWKDLLTAIDDPQPLDDDALAERMIGEIEAMGVDPGALLPRARIDEIARAVDAGDEGRAREAVRRLAPAAVRRLSRRVLTDKVLRGQADLYRQRYGRLVREERGRDGGGGDGAVSALLGSDPGRAFLLLDAAVGDLH